MDFEHVSKTDPRYTTAGDVRSIKNYRCTTCNETASTYAPGAPFCSKCVKYMLLDSIISDTKVAEIKSRKAPDYDGSKRKKTRKDRYTDGLVSEMKAVIHPRTGHGDIMLNINMDDRAFQKGLVHMKWSDQSFMTSIYEIGAAFHPFDPTPHQVAKESTGEVMIIKPKVYKGRTTLNVIEILGGQTQGKFENMIVTFKDGNHEAEFCMSDIAQVIQYAL